MLLMTCCFFQKTPKNWHSKHVKYDTSLSTYNNKINAFIDYSDFGDYLMRRKENL
jgi:hypothetical protein